MQMTRRTFGKRTLAVVAFQAAAGSLMVALLTGCSDQTTVAALLNEMITAWTSLETSLGKAVPANIAALFAQAVAAVQAWKVGTAAQDVVQVLQDLSVAVGAVGQAIPGMTAIEAAAVQIILGTIVNIVELIDPSAVPPVVVAGQARMAREAVKGASVPQKHFRQGQIPASALKKQFEVEWLVNTGKAA
jgi:hypothetical protein